MESGLLSGGKTQEFGEVLLESIDDSLLILGEEPKNAVYQYLSTIQSLERKDIPDHLEDFQSGLKSALGGAARVVERLILRKLFQKIGSTFKESSEYEFAEHVNEARRRFEGTRQRPPTLKDQMGQTKLKKG
jgi:hypothetical protein